MLNKAGEGQKQIENRLINERGCWGSFFSLSTDGKTINFWSDSIVLIYSSWESLERLPASCGPSQKCSWEGGHSPAQAGGPAGLSGEEEGGWDVSDS